MDEILSSKDVIDILSLIENGFLFERFGQVLMGLNMRPNFRTIRERYIRFLSTKSLKERFKTPLTSSLITILHSLI
jgi:hypothetical protein